jgi:hypothetical protein
MAAWPTVAHPAPPPYAIWLKNVMSPIPRLRATSTSMPSSRVNDESPSTSDGWMPASSSAALMARQASATSVPSRDLAKGVLPMPTIAVRSLIVVLTSP